MASVENVYHDFPRLAKQSGFYFQLHRGRVNWTEIENLVIEEITENRNFQLLERNLLNVINCNLEREYDLKILDQNFVKLFKLAQLGVDYLFYCEMYLDRCVVLLQEQLIALQEECESLKLGNQKMKEEMSKSTKKNKTQNYQCEKCEKVFISDVYLKYHDKRRHNTMISPENSERSQKKSVDCAQQTEAKIKLSASTQTVFFNEVSTATKVQDDNSINVPLVMKIENLEQELKDLKERLGKTESTLLEKKEIPKLNECPSFSVPGSMHGNSMLMFLPSYITQSGNGFYEINPRFNVSVPEVRQTNSFTSLPSVPSEAILSKPLPENVCQINTELEKPLETGSEKSEQNQAKEETKPISPRECFKTFQDYKSVKKENSEYDKENLDPNTKTNMVKKLTKPLPPPRSKKGIRLQSSTDNKIVVEPVLTKSADPEANVHFKEHLIVNNSTPIKEIANGETVSSIFDGSRENLSEINTPIANSNESLASEKSISIGPEPKSFIKKIVTRNSPNLQKISRNIRKSLTNLYDSVFFNEKDLTKKDSTNQELRATVVDGLNKQLRQLGVDPEWSGIPKKTMKEKLKTLNHRRQLLSKDNPAYPVLRNNIEEKLFHKLQNNLRKKKTVLINKLHKQESLASKTVTIQDSSEDLFENKMEFVKGKNPAMYENDTDSSSDTSDAEISFIQNPEQNILQKSEKSVVVEHQQSPEEEEQKIDAKKHKEFDLSVFQVRRGSVENRSSGQKCVSVNEINDALTDSDVEEDLSVNLNDKNLILPKEVLDKESANENASQDKNYHSGERQSELLHSAGEKMKNLSIEGALESKIAINAKKRVLFANYPSGFQEELSDSPTDDDLWSFNSEWAKGAV